MKESQRNVINLEDFRAVDTDGYKAKVYTGRDRGEDVRKESKIDDIEKEYDKVEVIIPKDVYSINPSFFEELFVNVVKKLGKENFLNKFSFKSLGNYDYNKPLAEAITRILRKHTAIG